MKLQQIIEQHWQRPKPFLRILLSPLSCLFAHVVAKRRRRFLSGSLKSQKLPLPVIVVGNIHVGGTGKTPITASLVKSLQNKGIRVGIISRGYGRQTRDIHILQPNSRVDETGDEPLMLYRQTAAPMAVGADRYAAGVALLKQYPDLQVIVSDDGLQHYALVRELELAVFPAADVGRDDLDVLPNGALREPMSRLQDVDFIVISQSQTNTLSIAQTFFRQPEKCILSETILGQAYYFHDKNQLWQTDSLKTGETCAALAAIARPQRFFDALTQMGVPLAETRVLPDHAVISVHDLPHADHVFITEKDAVKLDLNQSVGRIWVLPIQVNFTPDLVQILMEKLNI